MKLHSSKAGFARPRDSDRRALERCQKSPFSLKRHVPVLVFCMFVAVAAVAQQISAPEPQTSTIVGTAVDVNGDPVPRAQVNLEGPLPSDHAGVVANDNGFFQLEHLRPGVSYHITVGASGFADWVSPDVSLKPSQYLELTGVRLGIAEAVTTVHATVSSEEIATEQVRIEEHQRVLGFIPNFYVVYDRNPAPLTPELKFKLALRATTDPVTFLGTALIAGMDQAADKFDFQQGTKGYFQRFGASYANGFTDIIIGGAVLPSILHQDPRYFYQGTGTNRSRLLHAISYPFICRGDNGKLQPNYSSLGGYLASGAIANAYYPSSNRGVGLVFSSALVDLGASMANGILQEFVLRRLTPSAKERRSSEEGN
jgi:Carboxypeptidase regulatory-like domain